MKESFDTALLDIIVFETTDIVTGSGVNPIDVGHGGIGIDDVSGQGNP